MKREAIGKKVRFEIFKRDSFKCQYCGRSAPDVVLNVDHIMPVSKGGDNDITNLITSCFDCNSGKSDRTLDDDAAILKRKSQLDDLNERREQLEMMLDWHRSLIDIDEQQVIGAMELWNGLLKGYNVNERGKSTLKKLIKKYGLNEVLECMRLSVTQYVVLYDGVATENSVQKAFDYIGKIAANRLRIENRPYLKDLYYARGILKNRLNYYNHHKSLIIMETAHKSGVETDDIIEVSKAAVNWTDWVETMEIMTNG